MSSDDDHITLHGLGLNGRVGVPEAERAIPQQLFADVTLWPVKPLMDLGDDLGRTVNYSLAAGLCRQTVARGEYRLIETLADALCSDLLRAFPLRKVKVAVRKCILPDTDAVSVTLTRHSDGVTAAAAIP